jgi:hypothetical protein
LAGSTDDRGVVRFDGVQVGNHDVEAHIAGLDFPDLGIDDAPFPKDKELVGKTALLKQIVATMNDDETRVTIRPTRVGYIRGFVLPPKGRRAAEYAVQYYESKGVLNFGDRFNTALSAKT